MKLLTKITSLITLSILPILSFAYERIVILTPDVGDIIEALGEKDKVIGRDNANQNPAYKSVKTIGIHRNLSVEPIIALKPDLVIGSYMALPSSIFGRLNALKVKTINAVPYETVESYTNGIQKIGVLLDKKPQSNKIASSWQADMKARPSTKKRYLLSYDGRIVAGRGTVGDELIKRAGGINAANISGLKPLSREGWLAANADIIIVANHHQATLGTVEQFKKRPEIANNPAGKTGKVYYWAANDFLRFGLDSPQIIEKLHALAK